MGKLVFFGFAVLLGLAVASPVAAGERFVFATDWKAEAEHGGFYQALALGLYAKRGLDVEIREGGVGMDPQTMLAAGVIDGAIGSSSFFTYNLVEAGADVTTVAAIFQKDPTILMTHPRDDIKTLADMKGKSIMVGAPSVNTFWRWLVARYGFQDRQIRKYSFTMAPFLADPGAIQQGYVTSEPYLAEKGGVKPTVYLLADNGFAAYGCLIMVKGSLARDRRALVQAFVDATAEGWKSYLDGDPGPGNALIKKANPEMDDATLAFAIRQLKDRGIVEGGDAAGGRIGTMTPARWQNFDADVRQMSLYRAETDWRKGVDFTFVKGEGK